MSAPAAHACGTYAAYQRHRKRGEQPCDPCKQANTAYARDRRTRSEVRRDDALAGAARRRAYRRLADAHPAEFRRLYVEETIRGHAQSA